MAFENDSANSTISYTFAQNLNAQPYSYWSTFPPPPVLHYDIIGCVMTFVSIYGALSNAFVLFAFIRARKKLVAGSVFLCNLSFAGLLVSSLALPAMAVSSFKRAWIFGDGLCKAYGFLVGIGGMCSIATMAAIAFNRYRAIVKGTHYQSSSIRRNIYWLTVIWVYAGFWVGLPFVGFGSYVMNSYGVSCTFEYIPTDKTTPFFVVTLFIGGFILPLTVIIYCYTAIFLKVFNNEVRFKLGTSRFDFRAEGRRRADVKIAKVSAVVVIFFCMSWLPFAVVALLCAFGKYSLITPQIDIVTKLMGKASVVVSPIVYTMGHPVLKQTYRCCKKATERKRVTLPGRNSSEDCNMKSVGKTSLILKN